MVSEALALVIANWVFTIGGIAFTAALLPALFKKTTAIPVFTSGLTASFLWAYSGADVLLGLWAAVLANGSTALMWTLLLILRRPKKVV